jgi:hypothetical protein
MFDGTRTDALYPWPRGHRRDALLIAEGPLDALLAAQECRGVVRVTSLLSAGPRSLSPEALALLSEFGRLFVATDNDPAGNAAAAWLAGLFPGRVVRALPPGGCKDLTDAHLAGYSLEDWARAVVSGEDFRDPYDL